MFSTKLNNIVPSQLIHKVDHSPYCLVSTAGYLLRIEEETCFY